MRNGKGCILAVMRKLALLLALSLSAGLSAQTINTDRPDQTESSAVVPAGSFQWECGFSSTWTPTFGGTYREMALPNSLFRVSLHDKFELRVVHQLNRNSSLNWGAEAYTQEGTSDLEVGTKVQGQGPDDRYPRSKVQGPRSRFKVLGPRSRFKVQGPRFKDQGPRSKI